MILQRGTAADFSDKSCLDLFIFGNLRMSPLSDLILIPCVWFLNLIQQMDCLELHQLMRQIHGSKDYRIAYNIRYLYEYVFYLCIYWKFYMQKVLVYMNC